MQMQIIPNYSVIPVLFHKGKLFENILFGMQLFYLATLVCVVLEFLNGLQRLSVEINLYLPVNANTGWLIMLLAQFNETGYRDAFVLIIWRSF
jgi:hypothetical protein